MSLALRERTLAWDWYPGTIPENVEMEEQAYLETSYSFYLFRSREPRGLCIGRAASVYQGTMFDVGVRGRVHIGQYALVHGAWIVCDAEIEIGDHALISWNVVLIDSYRLPFDPPARRKILEQVAKQEERRPTACVAAKPIRIERNVWLGFEVCVLPGVTIGEGSVVGARSVVVESVPPYTMVCGNPARVIRRIPNDEIKEGPQSVHDQ